MAETLGQLTDREARYLDNPDVQRTFNRSLAGHRMTVLHDEGVYRHLRFRNPERGAYWFDLITWPGHLAITGDMGALTFARLDDMTEFFTGSYINNDYWFEKEKTRGRADLKDHDEQRFIRWVLRDFWDTSRDLGHAETTTWWRAIREFVLDIFTDRSTAEGSLAALRSIQDMYAPPRHYDDAWEADWTAYGFHAELMLAAIYAGVRHYRAARPAADREATR